MSDCNIIKVTGKAGLSWSTGQVIRPKMWAGRCPTCKEIVPGGTQYYYGYSNTNSRKTAKDALHLHMKQKHK